MSERLSPSRYGKKHLDGTVGAKAGDPGYWNLAEPDSEALRQLDKKLDSGEMPSFHRVRLL